MSFQGLDKILEIVTQQSAWEGYGEDCHLLKHWQTVVNSSLVEQTRPLYISRHILWVATASAVLAQELSLQRYTLLKKLNLLLPQKLEDIRFSSAQWNATAPTSSVASDLSIHPSYIEQSLPIQRQVNTSLENNTQKSFEQWLEKIRQRSQALPLCPQCQCPTPAGELQRWNCCAFCATKQFSHHT